ncbi:hypothetical protein N0V88_002368 [Collariella sp. IMI 366227]|nr:hypothetical protein N0V88_002368 [Collariella sp. IMI 366227]
MSSPLGDPDLDLDGLIGDLEAASKVPAKRRHTSIKPTVEHTTAALYDKGALPDELSRLVDLLTVRNHLDQASLGALVRNLYPARKVSDDVVLRFVGSLGHGQLKPSLPLQALFLRWLTGGDLNLTGLLRVFKNYYPEIIVGDITKGRAASFKSSVTLEEIDNAESFVNNLEKIELPAQLVAVLADPLLQKFLLLRPDGEASSRISNWLMACLGDVASGDVDSDLLLDMLEVIRDYAVAIKTLPPLFLTFFQEFLKVWDGSTKLDMVLETLSYTPLMEFESIVLRIRNERSTELYQILGPLEQSVLKKTPGSQSYLLRFYTLLLRRWTATMDVAEDLESLPVTRVSELIDHVNILTLTLTQTSPTVGSCLEILDFYDAAAALYSNRKLLRHVEIAIPPPLLIYLLFFNPSLTVMSRLCGILATYKRAWEAIMSPAIPRQLTQRERDQIVVFNGFLMDLCNCLWRGRAFSITDQNAQGCRLPQSVQPALEAYLSAADSDLSLGVIFGLSHSPLICLQSISHLRTSEDDEMAVIRTRHAGPVTQRSLSDLGNRGGLKLSWQDYRSGVLEHLETKGFPGVPELMYNTMKNLMRARRS